MLLTGRHDNEYCIGVCMLSLIARFMGPIWGPSGADRTQVGPMLASWTLLSGVVKLKSEGIFQSKRKQTWRSDDVMLQFFCIFWNIAKCHSLQTIQYTHAFHWNINSSNKTRLTMWMLDSTCQLNLQQECTTRCWTLHRNGTWRHVCLLIFVFVV